MGIRLVILAIFGLGTLWMIHLLAQDYNKIRKPVAVAAKALTFLSGRKRRDLMTEIQQPIASVDWDKVLRYDPLNCALSLICQLAAGAGLDTAEGRLIKEFIVFNMNVKVPNSIQTAYKFGKHFNNYKTCYKKYPICPYSARTMLKMIQIYANVFS